MTLLDVRDLVQKQREWTALWHKATPTIIADGLMELLQGNHLCNFLLWHEEDKARRDDRGHEFVYNAKRTIDRFNQNRNDYIERIDVYLQKQLPVPTPQARLHTETPGMIVDRLSILALKFYHMQEQTERQDVDENHLSNCHIKLQVIAEQISDLSQGLEEFMTDLNSGGRTFRLYKQYKMYNDPTLNPELYRRD